MHPAAFSQASNLKRLLDHKKRKKGKKKEKGQKVGNTRKKLLN